MLLRHAFPPGNYLVITHSFDFLVTACHGCFTGVVFQSVANFKSAEEAYRTSWHHNSCSNSARHFFPGKKGTSTSMSQEVGKEKLSKRVSNWAVYSIFLPTYKGFYLGSKLLSNHSWLTKQRSSKSNHERLV